jgi:hypothetical protein
MTEGGDVAAYFSATISLFKRTETYKWLEAANIVPGGAYRLSSIVDAIRINWGAAPQIQCDDKNRISEVYYFHNAIGSIRFGNVEPVGK